MQKSNKGLYFTVIISFLCAFSLMIVPIKPSLIWIRPDFVTLVLIFWVANYPNHVGVYFAFTVGLLFDLLTGMLFGSMGLTLGIVAFLTQSLRLRLRIYRFWQKFIVIMLMVACSQLIRLWIQMLIGHPPASFMYWATSLSSALAWPVVFVALQSIQRSLKIN